MRRLEHPRHAAAPEQLLDAVLVGDDVRGGGPSRPSASHRFHVVLQAGVQAASDASTSHTASPAGRTTAVALGRRLRLSRHHLAGPGAGAGGGGAGEQLAPASGCAGVAGCGAGPAGRKIDRAVAHAPGEAEGHQRSEARGPLRLVRDVTARGLARPSPCGSPHRGHSARIVDQVALGLAPEAFGRSLASRIRRRSTRAVSISGEPG